MSQDLLQISNMLVILHSMAADICHELALQNIQIPDVIHKVPFLFFLVCYTRYLNQLSTDGDRVLLD